MIRSASFTVPQFLLITIVALLIVPQSRAQDCDDGKCKDVFISGLGDGTYSVNGADKDQIVWLAGVYAQDLSISSALDDLYDKVALNPCRGNCIVSGVIPLQCAPSEDSCTVVGLDSDKDAWIEICKRHIKRMYVEDYSESCKSAHASDDGTVQIQLPDGSDLHLDPYFATCNIRSKADAIVLCDRPGSLCFFDSN